MKDEIEQLTLFPELVFLGGCNVCICRDCLMWWSQRCPHGECYDDYRAKFMPYDKAHPGEPPRTAWTNWKTDQAFWCRGGSFYPTNQCDYYQHYDDSKVRVESCLQQNVQIFQDGYILCGLVNTVGCTACWERFMKTHEIE